MDVRIVEVGPRDGLQNEAARIPTDVKVKFIDLLSAAGFPWIEVTSFVHPKAVPQMADADAVFAAIRQQAGVRYVALVPNPRGLDRALAAGVKDIALFVAATESFSRANINRSIAQSLDDARAVIDAALPGHRVRAYISVVFGCPYEGLVQPGQVRRVAERLFDLGVDEVVLGDTIGVATPGDVSRLLPELLELAPVERWGMHFHDTRGMALANVVASLDLGLAHFDSSAGGLGGCPFAAQAPPATWPPKTWSTCSTAWASRTAWTSTRSWSRRASSSTPSATRSPARSFKPAADSRRSLHPANVAARYPWPLCR